MARLFLRKNDLSENPKRPYFTLFQIIDSAEEGGEAEFKEIGAFWKAKTGTGYSGQFSEGVDVDTSQMKDWKKDKPAAEEPKAPEPTPDSMDD